jgi:amidase
VRGAVEPGALVVPVGVRGDGLPLAVRLVGAPGSDLLLLLLAVAGQFELAASWSRHAPGWPRCRTARAIAVAPF